MINNALDFEPWRLKLRETGRIQIPDFLQPEAAEWLWQSLANDVPWATAVRGEAERPAQPGSDEDQAIIKTSGQTAREGFHFVYDRYQMVKALKAGGAPEFPTHQVLGFFNTPQFLQFIRSLTGNSQLKLVGAQATRYRPGHFLRQHDDSQDEEGRRYAYVLNLSKDWQPDWGGLLQFPGADGQVAETLVPRWNSLSLFKVPTPHFVTQVMPWAKSFRYGITGWWYGNQA